MRHEILEVRFRSTHPAWHRIPNVWNPDTQVSVSEAIDQVAGDVDIQKLPITYTVNGVDYDLKSRVAVVRMPLSDGDDPVDFGVASHSWHVEQYSSMGRIFDELSRTHQVQTAGLLKDGVYCFVTLKAGEWDVLGDEMEAYFAIVLSQRPGVGHRAMYTPIRIVCRNTELMARAAADLHIVIPHSSDTLDQMQMAADLLERFEEVKSRSKELCEVLARKTLSVDEATKIFEAVWPKPVPPRKLRMMRDAYATMDGEKTVYRNDLDPEIMAQTALAEKQFETLCARNAELRETAVATYSSFEPASLQGTAWAAYNAVTEVSDWRKGSKNSAESSLIGQRAAEKNRAFDAALAVSA